MVINGYKTTNSLLIAESGMSSQRSCLADPSNQFLGGTMAGKGVAVDNNNPEYLAPGVDIYIIYVFRTTNY